MIPRLKRRASSEYSGLLAISLDLSCGYNQIFDQQVYHPEMSFVRCCICVDSKRFVEMFFVAGSIL